MAKKQTDHLERTLPHDLNAERAVLGAVIVNNAFYPRAAARVNESRFFREAHSRIWRAIANLLEKPHGCCDLLLVTAELARIGLLDECGGPAYVASLYDSVSRSTNIDHYATLVAEHALRRDIIVASNKAIVEAYAAEEPAIDVLRQHDHAILSMYRNRGGDLVPLSSRLSEVRERIEWYVANKGQLTGVPSGFTLLDQYTLGWQRGDLIIVAARPSIGKTTFALNCAKTASKSGRGAAVVFSMESTMNALDLRMLASEAGVSSTVIRRGYMGDETQVRLGAALNELGNHRIYIDDSTGKTVPEMRTDLRRLMADVSVSLVVIDYFTLMKSYSRRATANRQEELTEMSRAIKLLAKELNLPIMLLSQLSRKSEDRPDQQPILSDLRECGALEQDADLVAFLHRRNHREPGLTTLILAKQRDGPTGSFDLWLDPDSTTFTEATEDQLAEARTKRLAEKQVEKAQEKRKQIIRGNAIRSQERLRTGE